MFGGIITFAVGGFLGYSVGRVVEGRKHGVSAVDMTARLIAENQALIRALEQTKQTAQRLLEAQAQPQQ